MTSHWNVRDTLYSNFKILEFHDLLNAKYYYLYERRNLEEKKRNKIVAKNLRGEIFFRFLN